MIVNDTGKARRTSIALAVILGILQLSIVPNVGILGGRANLALVLVAAVCLGGETSKAPLVGFFSGLFYDLAGSGPIGLMALLLTFTGFALAAAGRSRVADDPTASIVLFVPVALVVEVVYAIVLLVFGQAQSFVEVVFMRALPGAVLDCLALGITSVVLARVGGGSGGFGGKHSGGGLSLKGL